MVRASRGFMQINLSAETIELARIGNPEAVAAVATAIRPLVERQVTRYAVSEADRQDLVQTTLLQVVRKLESFRGASSFSTWLFRVTANEALMLLRSQRRLRARMTESQDENFLEELPDENRVSFQTELEERERDASVRDALSELPEDYRDVVVAHYHLDLALNDIASRFRITESAVRSRLHRARTRLRTILEEPRFQHAVMA
jgi:RNA polymerase sigma-70 factor, ECF subfamily